MIGQSALFGPDVSLPLRKRVSVEIVSTAYARHALETYRYLHRTRTGRQLNYAVYIDGQIDGVITYAYPMTSAPIDGVPSDELLEFARLYLHSNIPHTATCAIGKSVKRVREDWKVRFPDAKLVRLLVSWSDTEYHKGTIYKAANFSWLRKSKHSGLGHHRGAGQPRTQHSDFKHEKDCWIYRWPS